MSANVEKPITALVSILCPDRVGLVSAVTGRLFDLGVNLGDTTFAVLGEGAEFTSVCELPAGLSLETTAETLGELDELDGAEVKVTRFDLSPVQAPSGRITHRIVLSGGDRPGLIARLSEVFMQFRANIVRLNAEQTREAGGDLYVLRLAVSIPDESVRSCLATVTNTAGEMGLKCELEGSLT